MQGNGLYNAILIELKKVIPTFAEYTLENGVRKFKSLPDRVTAEEMYKVMGYLRETLPNFCAPEDINLVIGKIDGILVKHNRSSISNVNDEKKEV